MRTAFIVFSARLVLVPLYSTNMFAEVAPEAVLPCDAVPTRQ